MPATTYLWTCSVCETTICEQELNPFRSKTKTETQPEAVIAHDTYTG
jgi:hypothetical protein